MVHSPTLEKKGKEKVRKNINDLGNTVHQRPLIYLDINFVLDYCICKNHVSVQSC